MRLRYGKPIKVESLLGCQNTPASITSVEAGYSYATSVTNGFYGDWMSYLIASDSTKKINVVSGHKYFLYVDTNMVNAPTGRYDCCSFIMPNGDELVAPNEQSVLKNNRYSASLITAPSSMIVAPMLWNYHQDWTIGDKINYMIIIDLTAAGMDGLTVQQIYDRYNRYFPMLATGQETLIDDKAGKIKTVRTLSDNYVELEYIESTGTQWIDTGYVPNANTRIAFDTKMLQGAEYGRQGRHGDGERLSIYITPSITEWAMGEYKQWSIDIYGQRHLFELDVPHLQGKLDGEVKPTFDPITWTNQQTLYLFGRNTAGGVDGLGNITNYNVKIWESGVLVRNFIPCRRKSDNAIGMYDSVNGVFYANQGTGVFVAGPVKYLPNEYQRVEYITFNPTSTSNGQFLRTGITSLTHPFSVKTVYNKTNTEIRDQCLVGQRHVGKFPNIYSHYYETVYGDTAADTAPDNALTTIEIKSGVGVIKNGQVIYPTSDTSTKGSTVELLIGAFTEDTYENYKWCFGGDVYDIEITNSGKPYRHYVPCFRKSDNEIGMYDLIEGQFYTNQGAGTFLKGNNVNDTLSCRIAGGSSDIYYGYNQSLFYDGAAPTSIVVEYGSYTVNGKEITYTKNADTPYYSLTLYNSVASTGGSVLVNCKPGDKILVSVTFKNFSDSLIGLVAGLGACLYKGGNWLRNPSGLFTFASGQKTYSVIDTVNNNNCDNAKFKLLHTTTLSGELFTVESASIINLTDWFGAGKEPATVAEFQQKFNKEYYGFYPTPIKLTQYQIAAEPYYSYNQISYDKVTTKTVNGITLTNNGDGSYSIQGTATADCVFDGFAYPGVGEAVTNHVFIIRGAPATSTYSTYYLRNDNRPTEGKVDLGNGQIFTWTYAFAWAFQLVVKSGTVITSPVTFWPECIDLTQWYGEGNEPTTIEEFKMTFPKLHYPYSTKRLLNQYMINKLVD